jgi:hypothetical protein
LLLNALPFLYVLGGVMAVVAVDTLTTRLMIALTWIYLWPPVIARGAVRLLGSQVGDALGQETRAYKIWWFVTQLQVPFNRLPVFEELLRIIPGVYPLWLRLWGAHVSMKVYWGPGALLTDRMLVTIGSGVVIGTRAVLSAHLAFKDSDGEFRVTIAPIEIGDDVLVGAYAGIGPGCRIEAGSEVPAASFLRPGTIWQRGPARKAIRPRPR